MSDARAPLSEVAPVSDGPGTGPGTAVAAGGTELRPDLLDRIVGGTAPRALRGNARVFWWGVWLVFLAYPISDMLSGRYSGAAAVLAWPALGIFAGLYLLAGWAAFGVDVRPRGPSALVPYLVLIAFAVPIIALNGRWVELVIYLGVATGSTLSRRFALPILIALAGFALAVALLPGGDPGNAPFAAFMTVALGISMMGFRRTILLIAELRAAREEVARLAVADERLRFARDLHDVLGQSLSVIALKAQVARRVMTSDPEQAAGALADLETVAHDSLGALRDMVTGYRQRSLTDELRGAREVLVAAGIRLEVSRSTSVLPGRLDDLLAWTVREGVTNVLRHSRAQSCGIEIGADDKIVRLEIIDDGVGGTESPGGSGLRGLRERLASVGGTLEAGPAPTGGFSLRVELPAVVA